MLLSDNILMHCEGFLKGKCPEGGSCKEIPQLGGPVAGVR